MKIIHALGWYFPESIGGSEIYVAGLSQRLSAAGHEVLIAAPFISDDPVNAHEKVYEHDGVPVFRYPIPAAPTREEAQGRATVRGAETFHRWLFDQRPDVVHFHSFVTGLGIAELKAAKAANARVIVTSHTSGLGYICQRGSMMQWGETLCDGVCQPSKCAACELQHRGLSKSAATMIGNIPSEIGGVARNLPGKFGTALGMSNQIARNQTMQRELLETADKFVLLTEWALNAVAANGAPREKLALNRLGLSWKSVSSPRVSKGFNSGAEALAYARATDTIKVGYLGRFEAIKGVKDLARAVASLPESLPLSVEFRGPVKSPAEQSLVNGIKTLIGNRASVSFAPAVSAEDVPAVLAGYDVLCCPSLCLEGGPTVAIEAHAVGTPVIGTAIGGLAELVTDGVNGRLVKPGDWRALAEVLAEVATNPGETIDRWRTKLPAARTMDEIAADYQELYQL
ncbi:MAG: glycosyltransferase [Acidobacteriota bacterium]|nr:glycosyltransferase [Acidobacteriota bacterium]